MDALLTTTEAATAARVSKQLIYAWRVNGKLKPADYDPRGRPLYRERDVLEVERDTRRSPNSHRVPQPA